jgi:hypothetical protein
MTNPAERDPNLILLILAGYPLAAGIAVFAAWASFWSLGVRTPLSPTLQADQNVPGDVSDELGADW